MAKSARQVRVRGVEELAKKLRQHGIDVMQGLEKITMAAAEVIRAEAESRAGGDIEVIKETAEKGKGRIRVAIGPPKAEWYAKFREFGASAHEIRPMRSGGAKALRLHGNVFRARVTKHPGVAAQPFLRPAADEKQRDALAAGAAEMKRVTGL